MFYCYFQFYKETLKCSDETSQQEDESMSPTHDEESVGDNDRVADEDVEMKDDDKSETKDG